MKHLTAVLLTLPLLVSCAGIPVPFTHYRLLHAPIETDRDEVNSGCLATEALIESAENLEKRHLSYLQSQNQHVAVTKTEFIKSLGTVCSSGIVKLTTAEIKIELDGSQYAENSENLRELGGLLFEYENVATDTEIELSGHFNGIKRGHKLRLVAIYRLTDEKVLHYNFSGQPKVDKKHRTWPIDQFLWTTIRIAIKAMAP